jgi:hypothetical protein
VTYYTLLFLSLGFVATIQSAARTARGEPETLHNAMLGTAGLVLCFFAALASHFP